MVTELKCHDFSTYYFENDYIAITNYIIKRYRMDYIIYGKYWITENNVRNIHEPNGPQNYIKELNRW